MKLADCRTTADRFMPVAGRGAHPRRLIRDVFHHQPESAIRPFSKFGTSMNWPELPIFDEC